MPPAEPRGAASLAAVVLLVLGTPLGKDGEPQGMGGVGRDRGGVKGTRWRLWRLPWGYPPAVHARVLLELVERALGGQTVGT